MTADITLEILKTLQNGQADIKQEINNLRSDITLQLAAINEKLSGQLLAELEYRNEIKDLRERLSRIETRLELND